VVPANVACAMGLVGSIIHGLGGLVDGLAVFYFVF